ncbi:MAG: aspartate carbamoyltransferase catalytic subunit [Sporolactobacillus sp.]
MANLLSLNDLSETQVYRMLGEAARYADMAPEALQHANGPELIANLFYEPSTRTHFSFETAERRLGYQVLNFDSKSSSVTKGETLYDTVRTMEAIGCRAVVIRHPEDRYYRALQEGVNLAILNAGDGAGSHPTQALLDLLTLQQEFGRIEGLRVAIIGDLRYSRVAASDAAVLERLGAKVLLSGPEEWQNHELPGQFMGVDEAIETADAVMMLRIQHERHEHAMRMTKDEYHARYGMTLGRAASMKPRSIIMHPGPVNRGVELDSALVESPRSRYFKQIHNGVAVRMAALEWALANTKKVQII